MRIFVTFLCLMFPVAAAAQNPGMNGGDMQKMMQLMQEMQQCMAKVDQGELEKLEEQSEKFTGELDALCKNGEREKAQKEAIAYSKKMMKNPALLQMKKCGEMTKGLVPDNSMGSFDDEFDFANKHVCDE